MWSSMNLRLASVAVSTAVTMLVLMHILTWPDTNIRLPAMRLPHLPDALREAGFDKTQQPLTQMNATLGFEEVYVVNLPDRSDKRDSTSLAAAVSGIKLRYVEGVRGHTISDKALPHNQEDRHMTDGFLGSWRAHLNTIRDVVERNLTSALIIEDDADWDVRIKQQLMTFAEGARFLQGVPAEGATHSPYGDDWDVLWLGSCVDEISEPYPQTFQAHDDASACSVRDLVDPGSGFMEPWMGQFEQFPPHTRVVHWAGPNLCTYAYAVSRQGARKLLYNLAVHKLDDTFDNSLSWMCRDQAVDARCLSVFPSLFHPHKSRGAFGKNSDNVEYWPEEQSSHTDVIMWPVKVHYEELIRGQTDFPDQYPLSEAQWRDRAQIFPPPPPPENEEPPPPPPPEPEVLPPIGLS